MPSALAAGQGAAKLRAAMPDREDRDTLGLLDATLEEEKKTDDALNGRHTCERTEMS